MKTLPAVTRILERAYAPEPDERTWLEGILDASKDAFDGHAALQIFTATVTPDAHATFHTLAGDDAMNASMLQMLELARATEDTAALSQIFFGGPVSSVRKALACSRNPVLRKAGDRNIGKSDVVGALGLDPSGRTCAIGWMRPGEAPLPRRVHDTISRVAGHLSAAYRLRHHAAPREAVLDHRGEVLEADDAVLGENSEVSLREAALAIDRARREVGVAPDAALGHWRALVEGRWTLVERIESGGRRVLVARPNEPATRPLHALDAAERKVVALVAICHPSKLIAYELGMTESMVSRLTASALGKLGARSRAELIELHGALVGDGEGVSCPE